jgi:hypothetical protein
MNPNATMKLDISGMGLVFYSPFAARHIKDGEDYLASTFEDPRNVQEQAQRGELVGVNVGTPGSFILSFFDGYPAAEVLERMAYKLRLGIQVRDGRLCVRDLFDLMNWSADSPTTQCLEIEDGSYHLTLLSSDPPSGVLGDNQLILVYLQKLDEFPQLHYEGVPTLC